MIKLANIKPPKNPWTKIDPPPPPPPQILYQYLLRHANLKLIKIKLKLFAANIFINGMFQVLN